MQSIVGLIIIFLAGALSGLFTTPARFIKGWEWENFWLVYSIFGLLTMPWALALFSTDAVDILAHTPGIDILYTMASGFGWGIGSVTFGLGCQYVGDSLAFAIILGLCATLGTAVPMLILSPEDAGKKVGIYTWIGIGVVCIGLYLISKAGQCKERDQAKIRAEEEAQPLMINTTDGTAPKERKSFAVGLLICAASGVFSGFLNVGLTLGSSITDAAAARGASSVMKKNVTWALVVSAGFIPNAIYSIFLLSTRGTWINFSHGVLPIRIRNVTLGAVMGVTWFTGNFVYGAGASGIGLLGTVVGWPIFMVSMVLSSVVASVLSGDYKGVSTETWIYLAAGLITIFAATVIVSIGSL
eukprot:m.171767 g.171767  ORF g.171767 m.171767 type:complete len:356 (+) comp13418_c0_seq1:68-1135(+)